LLEPLLRREPPEAARLPDMGSAVNEDEVQPKLNTSPSPASIPLSVEGGRAGVAGGIESTKPKPDPRRSDNPVRGVEGSCRFQREGVGATGRSGGDDESANGDGLVLFSPLVGDSSRRGDPVTAAVAAVAFREGEVATIFRGAGVSTYGVDGGEADLVGEGSVLGLDAGGRGTIVSLSLRAFMGLEG